MPDPVAQDELNRYFSTKDKAKSHPEDAGDDSDRHLDVAEKPSPADAYHSDSGDDQDTLHSMSATPAAYHIPRTVFDANTGPKGVIADAQSYDRARKSSLRKTFLSFANGSYFNAESKSRTPTRSPQRTDPSEKASRGRGEDDDEEDLMDKWRQNRLRELTAGNPQKQPPRRSPVPRMWGFFKEVDAKEYLDVVEKTPSGTIVVVCIYDPESDDSTAVEESLRTLAQKHPTTRFVKLHHEIADMESVSAPAIIAYRKGDVIAMLTDCTAIGLETTLRRNGILVDTEY